MSDIGNGSNWNLWMVWDEVLDLPAVRSGGDLAAMCILPAVLKSNHTSRSCSSDKILKGKEVRQMLYIPKESGQGLVEYALILVLVAVVVIVVLALLGPAIGNVFSNILSNM